MAPNQASVWKVMTIWVSRKVPLFNFERRDILFARIGHPCKKLWPFEFLEGFRCSISSISIYKVPESDIRVKTYDHLNFSRTFVVQFRASRYIMTPNWTSVWKVMTISISQEVSLYNFERLDILRPRIVHSRRYDHLNTSRGSVVIIRASRHIMHPNRTSVWKVMTRWISREVLVFNFERLDILSLEIGHPFEKIGPFEFLDGFRCSISSVTIYNAPESDIRVKSYDHLNFSRVSVVQFRTCRYIMVLNRTYVW